MQAIGIILVLINVLTVAGPVVGVAIMYQDNLTELVVPPEVTRILNNTIAITEQTPLVKIVSFELNNATRTVTLTANFTNPLNCTLSLRSMSANVICKSHSYTLGQLTLGQEVDLPALEMTPVIAVCTWTGTAEIHLQMEHAGATSLDVILVGFAVNVNDMNMEMSEPIEIPNVPLT
jgi:hypothetical protein